MADAITGIISLWSGAIVDIPAGWVLCDGTAGTPDLRDLFVIGAGGGFSPGDTGGTVDHTHTFTGDGHLHTSVVGAGPLGTGVNFRNFTTTNAASGTTNDGGARPPFHALAYIMKT